MSPSRRPLIFLRVFAREMDGVYCMSCRRPDSDFDETRSRRSFWAKTKFETPLIEIQAHVHSAPGPPKGGIFDPPKNQFLAKFFFLSNRREMFAMGFLVVFIPEMSSLWNFWAILSLGWDPALEGPRKAQEGNIFIRRDIIKISVPRRKTSWVYHMTWRVSIGSERGGRNLTSKFDFLKMSRFALYLWPGWSNPFQPIAQNIP